MMANDNRIADCGLKISDLYNRQYAIYFAVTWLLFCGSALAGDWPGWRGPSGSGVSPEDNLPIRWSATENVLWKVRLQGAGVSTPVVSGERVFLTASDGRLNDRLHVYCYRRTDGRELWHTRLFGSAPTDLYAPGGMAVPTPTSDGKHLFALFGTGDLACLDFTGKPRWIRSLAEEYGPFRNRWGMGASPILVGDLLVVQVDHWGPSYLLGIDSRSGANRWKVERDATVNWSSPFAARVKDETHIVVVGTYRAKGYRPKDGKELWTVSGLGFQCIPTPVPAGGLVLAASGEGTLAIRLDGARGDLTKSHVVWASRRGAPFVPSPVSFGGYCYLVDDKGFATCLEAATGKQVWKERLGKSFQASLVAGDGKVYYPNLDGGITVMKAGPRPIVLARNELGEMIVASPAIANGRIFIRGEKHLFCIGRR
jgi:outer membrane protein assembly factor BamB